MNLTQWKRSRRYKEFYSQRFNRDIHVILAIEQVAQMLMSGIEMRDAWETVAEDGHRRVRVLAAKILACLDSGSPLSEGFRPFVDDLAYTMFQATEQAGIFAQGLQDYASRSLARRAWRDRLIKVLVYPFMLLFMCYALALFIRFDVDPSLTKLKTELAPTQSTGFASWLASNLPIGLIALITAAACTYAALFIARNRSSRVYVSLPFDKLIQAYRSELFAYRLYIQLAAGISVVDSLHVGLNSDKTTSWIVQDCGAMRTAILEGRRFSESLPGSHDALLQRLAAVGERTGDLSGALERASQLLQERVLLSFELLGRWLEPIVTSVLGIVVGSTVYGVFGPMYQTVSQLGQH